MLTVQSTASPTAFSGGQVFSGTNQEHIRRSDVPIKDLSAVIATFDRDGIFTLSEGKGTELLGLPARPFGGPLDLANCKLIPAINSNIDCCLTGKTIQDEFAVGPLVYDTLFAPVTDRSGNILGGMLITSTCRETRHVPSQLNANRLEHTDAAIETKFGVWDWNLLTNDLNYSDAWMTMLGYPPGELKNGFDTYVGLVHPDDLDRVLRIMNAYLAGLVAEYQIEMRLKTNMDGYHWFRASGKVFDRMEDGKPIRMVGIHVDINEQKAA